LKQARDRSSALRLFFCRLYSRFTIYRLQPCRGVAGAAASDATHPVSPGSGIRFWALSNASHFRHQGLSPFFLNISSHTQIKYRFSLSFGHSSVSSSIICPFTVSRPLWRSSRSKNSLSGDIPASCRADFFRARHRCLSICAFCRAGIVWGCQNPDRDRAAVR
jgi:hypothetical protein